MTPHMYSIEKINKDNSILQQILNMSLNMRPEYFKGHDIIKSVTKITQ